MMLNLIWRCVFFCERRLHKEKELNKFVDVDDAHSSDLTAKFLEDVVGRLPDWCHRERKKREKAEGYQKKEREEAAAKAQQEQKAAEEAARAAEDAADAKKIRLREKKAMQKERSRLRTSCTDIGAPWFLQASPEACPL